MTQGAFGDRFALYDLYAASGALIDAGNFDAWLYLFAEPALYPALSASAGSTHSPSVPSHRPSDRRRLASRLTDPDCHDATLYHDKSGLSRKKLFIKTSALRARYPERVADGCC